jgi:phosphatidate cytidylyltransferase
MKRLLTAAALIPVVAYVVLLANPWIFGAVLLTVAFLCYREFEGIASSYRFGSFGPLGYGLGIVLLFAPGDIWLALVAGAILAAALAMKADDLSQSLPRAAFFLFGVAYIFGCWKCASLLRDINRHWLMFGLLVNWVGDAGAYYAGRKFGRHKLAPRVSPNKTWEGAIAAVAVSCVAGLLYLPRFTGISIPVALGVTVAANVAGQFGDLAESAMKRGAGVKDSGSLLPGHGGMLDRVDSTLFALPAIYLLLKLV